MSMMVAWVWRRSWLCRHRHNARIGIIVESHWGYVGSSDDPFEGLRDRVRMHRLAGSIGEHPLWVLHSDRREFCLLPIAPGDEQRDGGGVDVDTPPGVAGFGTAHSGSGR